jgi:hypothetical protein
MKRRITLVMRAVDTSPLSSWLAEYPDIIERYPGSKGRTQGEMKEMTPAPNAIKTWTR